MVERFYKSENSYIVYNEETDYGVEDLSSKDTIGKIVGTAELPDPVKDTVQESYFNTGRTADRIKTNSLSYDTGSLTVKPTDKTPFYFLLGAEDGNGNIIQEEGNDKPSMTLQAVSENTSGGDLVRTFTGVLVPSGSISASEEEDLEVEIDLMAIDGSDDESKKVSKTEDTGEVWEFSDGTVFDMYGVSFDGLTDLQIDFEEETDERRFFGGQGKKPDAIILGEPNVTAEFTISVNDAGLYNEFLASESGFTVNLEFDNGTDIITFVLKGCKFEQAPHNVPESGEEVRAEVSLNVETMEIQF